MAVKVYYVSPKGCAEMIASAICAQIGGNTKTEALMPAYMPENTNMMFIGCEGSKADKVTAEFLNSLNPGRVRNAALYSCSPKKDTGAIDEMRSILEGKGINVLASSKAFPGKGFLSGKKPDKADLEDAKKWASECMASVK